MIIETTVQQQEKADRNASSGSRASLGRLSPEAPEPPKNQSRPKEGRKWDVGEILKADTRALLAWCLSLLLKARTLSPALRPPVPRQSTQHPELPGPPPQQSPQKFWGGRTCSILYVGTIRCILTEATPEPQL